MRALFADAAVAERRGIKCTVTVIHRNSKDEFFNTIHPNRTLAVGPLSANIKPAAPLSRDGNFDPIIVGNGRRSDFMDCTVRQATADDVDRLALIGSATFLETFAGLLAGPSIVAHCKKKHSASAYERIHQDGAAAWLAETNEGEAPVGYAVLTLPNLPGCPTDGSALELKRIYLLSRFQGRRLGQALLDHVLEEARRRRAASLWLGVFRGNEPALGFYRHNGFTESGTRSYYIGDREYEDLIFSRPV